MLDFDSFRPTMQFKTVFLNEMCFVGIRFMLRTKHKFSPISDAAGHLPQIPSRSTSVRLYG